MRLRLFLIPALLAAITAAVLAPSPAIAFIDRGEVVSRTLANGLAVYVREEPACAVAELQVWTGAGSRDEEPGKEGIAHLFEHMLFKGTPTRKVGEIAAAVESAGGEINAWTSHDETVYHVTIPAAEFDTALAVLADAVQHSSFDPAELEREKKVVAEEIRQGLDQPAREFQEKIFAAAYPVHPYGRKVIGTADSVAAITREDMVRFFRSWYQPANMRLVVVGGVNAGQVFARAAALFTAPAAAVPARRRVVEPLPDGPRFARMTADTDPARVSLSFPIGGLTDPATPALDLLAAVLSQGESARLPVEVRDRGAALSAWAGAFTPADPGLFMLGAQAEQGRTGEALRALLAQLRRLREESVPRGELERARGLLLSDKVFSREQVEGQAREIGSSLLIAGDPAWGERYYSRLQAVEPADILLLARELFRPGRALAGFLTREAKDQPDDGAVRAALEEALGPQAAAGPGAGAGETAAAAEGGAGTAALPQGVLRRTLRNGVTVLVREDHRLPVVAVKAGVMGGLRYESAADNGGFNLLAGMVTRGSEGRSAADLARRLDEISASLSGFSGRNSFGIDGKFLSRDFAEGLGLARETLTRATLPEEELALARARTIAAIRARRDRLSAVAFDLFNAALYRSHPYRFPVAGSEATVSAATREGLLALYRRAVRPQGMVVSICGDIDAASAFALAEREFGALSGPAGSGPAIAPEEALTAVRETRTVREGKEQTHVVLGFFGPTLRSEDREAVDVLNAVLAGQGGRLFTELRDKRSLAYSVGSMVSPGVETGSFAFVLATSPAREREAVEGFLREIRRIRDADVSPDELSRARRSLAGGAEIGLQTAAGKAEQLFFPALYGQDLPRALAYPDRVRAVTAGQVREAARRYLDPERYVLSVVEARKASSTGPGAP